jgi:REP element-mobilizing transposase RayT
MTFDPQNHHRQSHRLKGYDYSLSAPYFVTLCTEKFLCLFGNVEQDKMVLSEQGKMIERWLFELRNKFSGVLIDTVQVMPNHLHAIIVIMGGGLEMAARFGIGTEDLDMESADYNYGTPIPTVRNGRTDLIPQHPTLGRIVQWFKTMTTNDYIRGVRQTGWKPFPKRLWQRDYFDHIIRNEVTLERTRDYIQNNPLYWSIERERPDRMGRDTFEQWLLEGEL